MGKGGSRETRQEAIAISQARDGGGLDHPGNSRYDENCSLAGYIWRLT